MPSRLVALDEGSDIPLDRTMVVVGRHPECDARLDSLRVSRHHCCMTQDNGDVVVRDLGSTNGIRINGQRVEVGRLRPGDELSIAHIRYRLDGQAANDATLADPQSVFSNGLRGYRGEQASVASERAGNGLPGPGQPAGIQEPIAAAVRDLLPAGMSEKCRIQVIVHMEPDDVRPEVSGECPRDSSR